MVVAPNSTIILYSGMPLDDTYSDTLYFATKSNRDGFFTNVNNPYRKMVLEQNTYQRVNSGVFEAKVLADEVYDVNYMAFQNTNFGNKWFYAFVESVEYINNLNTRISYKIDVIQTYLFDCDFEDCLVEREHSQYDTLFENYLPEPLQMTEYVYEDYQELNPTYQFQDPDIPELTWSGHLRDRDVVIQYVDVEGTASDGSMVYQTYVGCKYRVFDVNNAGTQHIDDWIAENIQKPEMIINMYMCPSFLSLGTVNGSSFHRYDFEPLECDLIPNLATFFSSISGYQVRNKKLFTYPYSYLHIDDSMSNCLALRYEFFDLTKVNQVAIYGTPVCPVQLCLYPINYKNNPNSQIQDIELFTENLTIANFPLCSWNYDTYKAWIAQNSVPLLMKSISDVVGAVGSVAGSSVRSGELSKGGAIGGVTSLVQSALSIANAHYQASIKADTMRGTINNGNALYGWDKLGFNYGRAHQPVEFLEIFDQFFDVYGYTTNKVKKPNISSRPHWNYVKTNGAKLIGACPTESLRELCNIFDNGITFWKNASEVGNYSLDNRPVALPNP